MIATSWLAPNLWQQNQEDAIREAIKAGADWTEYLRLVDRHRTPALSWAALRRVTGLEIPEFAKSELQKRSDACRMQAVMHSLLLAQILKAFNHAGIPVMVLKGPMLSLDLYGDVGLRHSRDLDLAVALGDICRAQACLSNLGWRIDSTYFSLTPRQRKKFWQMERDLCFFHSQAGCALDLQWRNRWDTPSLTLTRWARSIPSTWQGCSYLAMNPADQILYLCCHGTEHAWFRAKWLGDLARIHAAEQINWGAILNHAQSTEQEKPLLACLQLLHVIHRLPLPYLHEIQWESLSSFLIGSPLYALKIPKDPAVCGVLDSLPGRLRLASYAKWLLPRKTWRESLSELFYFRQDFNELRLPDSLFWAYVPLRPILWIWRKSVRILAHKTGTASRLISS